MWGLCAYILLLFKIGEMDDLERPSSPRAPNVGGS